MATSHAKCANHSNCGNYIAITKSSRKLADRAAAWLEEKGELCHDCYIADRDAKNSALLADVQKSFVLPTLIGTEKQIAWANVIVAKFVSDAQKPESEFNYPGKAYYVGSANQDEINQSLAVVLEQTSAKFWIENRDMTLIALARSLTEVKAPVEPVAEPAPVNGKKISFVRISGIGSFTFNWKRSDGDLYSTVMGVPTAKYVGGGTIHVSEKQFEAVEVFAAEHGFVISDFAKQEITAQKNDPIYLLKQLAKQRINDDDDNTPSGSVVVVEQVISAPKSKSGVMKRAWAIAREAVAKFGGKVKEFLSQSLVMAWSEYHAA